jgi:hypothetical protein
VDLSGKIYSTFLIICIIGLANGGFLLFKWYREKDEFSRTIQTIKKRIKKEETPALLATEPDSTVPTSE